MKTTRVKLNIGGIRQVIRGPEATAELKRRLDKIAEAAGPGFEAVVKPARYTARGYVQSVSAEAAKREAESKVLTRALDAGR